jgi:hypothetical protein
MIVMPRNENEQTLTNTDQKIDQRRRPSAPGVSPFIERHYSASELAALWNLSLDTIRRIFENEPGVLVLGDERGNRNR